MARRRCCGKVDEGARDRRFLPEGGEAAGVTRVLWRSFEAIRLKDLEGLDQSAAPAAMGLPGRPSSGFASARLEGGDGAGGRPADNI
jgi:predicted DNA-binding protein (UPF0251 family)